MYEWMDDGWIHCENDIVKITILLVSTVAYIPNLVCHTGCCGYMHDVTMTTCAPSEKCRL